MERGEYGSLGIRILINGRGEAQNWWALLLAGGLCWNSEAS